MSILISINQSKIPFLASKDPEEVAYGSVHNWPDCDFDQITNYINSKNINLSSGDIIAFAPLEKIYRNGSKCIWYANSAHSLADDLDDYDALPNVQELQLKPGSIFHPRYWSETIDHNGYYWICEEYRNQCVQNVEVKIANNQNKLFITWFEHNGKKEYLVFNSDYVYEEELDLVNKEKFIQLIQDQTIPFDWSYDQFYDIFIEDMDKTNTSIIHGIV